MTRARTFAQAALAAVLPGVLPGQISPPTVPPANEPAVEDRIPIEAEGIPWPGPVGRGKLALPREVILPALDAETEQRLRREHGPSWLGPTRALPSEIYGTWTWTQEGKRVWRVTIRVTGARALRIRFESFSVQGSVWLYGDEWSGPQIGPHRGGGPYGNGSFWSEFVFRETVTIEYVPDDPATASEHVPFRVRSVAQIVDKGFPGPGGRSKARGVQLVQPRYLAGCHLDVSCYPDLESRDQPGVARMYITKEDQTVVCTGFLINPSYDSDDRLLLLTAGHCIGTQEEARTASFLWNYQTERCYGNPDWRQWAEPLAFTYGATLVVSKDDRSDDFTLLMLSKAEVQAKTGWRAWGWRLAPASTGTEVYTVTHPVGEFKRVAFGQVMSTRWRGLSSLGFGAVQWRLGTAESGSSGSPLFSGTGEPGHVVGILTADNRLGLADGSPWGPYCDADLRTAFNRFDHIYDTIKPYMESESALPALFEPPAPPPSPPPFKPQPVEVALGASGQSITLMTTETGGFTLNGRPVSSGDTYKAANGNYTLMLRGDVWTATFSPETMDVALGSSGQSVRLTQLESGGYAIDGRAVSDGDTYTAPDGNEYRLTFRDGEWTAALESGAVQVALGNSGQSITLTQLELGVWTAQFLVGGSNLTLTVRRGSTSSTTVGSGDSTTTVETTVEGGIRIALSNGNVYTVTLESGSWIARYVPKTQHLQLGTSGRSVTITSRESGGWRIGFTNIWSGYLFRVPGGNVYQLGLLDGVWRATVVDSSAP